MTLTLIVIPPVYGVRMLRPESWTKPAGVSPVRVGADAPGSRPRFVVERWRVERGVESLFWGEQACGPQLQANSAASLHSQRRSRAAHVTVKAMSVGLRVGDAPDGFFRGTGSGTYAWFGSEQERPVCAALSAKTGGRSRW